MRKKRACIEFDQNFQFFDRPKTGALYFCHMVIGSEQNQRVGYEDMSERPDCAPFGRILYACQHAKPYTNIHGYYGEIVNTINAALAKRKP